MTKRNAIVLAVLVVCFVTLQLFSEHFAGSLTNVPWQTSTAVVAVLFFLFGASAFFLLHGGFWTQATLATSVPVLTQVILQLGWGSDPAYSGLTLLLAVPYAVLFFLGTVFVGGPVFLYRQARAKSHLTLGGADGRSASAHH
jgi:hypothetical protein